MTARNLIVCSAFLILAGCGASSVQLKRRAAADFGCDATSLTLSRLDSDTYQVSGCNQRATYVSSCYGNHSGNCSWILNSDISSDGPIAAAPARVAEQEEESQVVRQEARIESARAEDGSTKLKLFMKSYDWTLYFAATPRTDGKLATVVWRIPKTHPKQDCEIKIAADGVRVELGETTELIERKRSLDYQTTMPYASLLTIAKSTRVAGRLCGVEATLTETQLDKVRELVVRIREEHAWDEEPERTADEATVAPTEL